MAVNDAQSAMSRRLENNTAAQPAVYKAKPIDGPLPEYEAMRRRVQQQANADTQQQQDAMQRRFAAQGGMNSGAALKQQQLIAEAGAQRREQAEQDISGQESAERRRLQEMESGREFQSQEAANERSSNQAFQANESRLGREQQQSQFDADLAFKTKVDAWQQTAAFKQLDLAAQESAFNQAAAAAKMSDDERRWLGYAQGGKFDINDARTALAMEKAAKERDKRSKSVFGWAI